MGGIRGWVLTFFLLKAKIGGVFLLVTEDNITVKVYTVHKHQSATVILTTVMFAGRSSQR